MLTVSARAVKERGSKWQIVAIDFFRRRKKRDFAPLAHGTLEEYFAAHDFNRVPADAHVNYPVIGPLAIANFAIQRSTDKNPAGPMHLHALLDEDAFFGFRYAVRHHPGRGTTRGRARCRVLAIVEEHAGMQPGFAIHGFAGDKIKKLTRSFGEILGGAVQVDLQVLNYGERLQRRHGEWNAG